MLLELLDLTKFSFRLPHEPSQNFVTLIPLIKVFQVLHNLGPPETCR